MPKTQTRWCTLIEVCICGHGKIHHDGKFAECTCDIGTYKNQKLCNFPDFKLDMKNPKNQRIIEWMESNDIT